MRYWRNESWLYLFIHFIPISIRLKVEMERTENIQFIAFYTNKWIKFALQIYILFLLIPHFHQFSYRFLCFAGNVFVIAAILLEKNLQSVANYLILSLAVADLLVACLVMPLSAVYEISREWKLGPELCDMWTSSDVLCCTASILHLVAIALDR